MRREQAIRRGVAFVVWPGSDDAGVDALIARLEAARTAATTRAIVVDAGTDDVAPSPAATRALCRAIGAGSRRVYFATGGAVARGGLAVLLACDGVYITPAATIAGPEVLEADAGVTLRDRAEAETVRTLLAGTPIDAIEAYTSGLVDGIVVGDLPVDTAVFAGRESTLPRGRYVASEPI